MNYEPFICENKLRDIRMSYGMRQQDLANILGFTTTDRISHWEKGQAMPNIINLFRLCRIFQVYPHQLYPALFEKITQDDHQPGSIEMSHAPYQNSGFARGLQS